MNLTSQMVKDFWAYMTDKYGTTVKSKANANEMELIASFLNVMGITDKEAFLTRFTTTIGKTIYVPFTIGEEKDCWNLWAQTLVCVHEHQHVIQAMNTGEGLFFARYLLDPTYRATYEGEGYRTNMTLNFWAHGTTPDVEPYLYSIKSYGLGEAETTFFRKFLTMSIPTIIAGGIPDEAARVAIAWLEEHRIA